MLSAAANSAAVAFAWDEHEHHSPAIMLATVPASSDGRAGDEAAAESIDASCARQGVTPLSLSRREDQAGTPNRKWANASSKAEILMNNRHRVPFPP